MAVGLSMRLSPRVALLLALVAIPQMSSARDDAPRAYTDYDFYTVVASRAPSPATSPNASPGPRLGESTPATDPLPATAAARTSPGSSAPQAAVDDHRSFVAEVVALPPATLGTAFIFMALAGLLLWGIKPLRCLLIGHRRSRMSVRFDDREQRWVSDCKCCKGLLIRDAAGAWRRGGPRKARRIAEQSSGEEAQVFVFSRAREAQSSPIEHVSKGVEQTQEPAVPPQVRARSAVTQLLDDVQGGNVPTPGARGALFSVVDELRARLGSDDYTLCAEKISLRMQQLECALQRGDKDEAKLARRDLKALAGKWMTSEASAESAVATEQPL